MLYKTVWHVIDETTTTEIEIKFTYYHFGKAPKLPSWYYEEGHVYTIETIWSTPLVITLKTFYKCLTHSIQVKQNSY